MDDVFAVEGGREPAGATVPVWSKCWAARAPGHTCQSYEPD